MSDDPPQFGAATVITHDVRLILCDCFETLVELDGGAYRPRRGVRDFLIHFASHGPVPVAVISDADPGSVEAALRQAGIRRDITGGVYHSGNAAEVLPDGRTRKRLDAPLADFQVSADRAVFVGDSPLDAEAARHHGVPFIRVPRSEDRSFSFVTLITGPSRYRSSEFSTEFLRRYDAQRKKPQ